MSCLTRLSQVGKPRAAQAIHQTACHHGTVPQVASNSPYWTTQDRYNLAAESAPENLLHQ